MLSLLCEAPGPVQIYSAVYVNHGAVVNRLLSSPHEDSTTEYHAGMRLAQREAFPEQKEQQGLLMPPCALPLQGANGPLTPPFSEAGLLLPPNVRLLKVVAFPGITGPALLVFKGPLQLSGGLAWPAW